MTGSSMEPPSLQQRRNPCYDVTLSTIRILICSTFPLLASLILAVAFIVPCSLGLLLLQIPPALWIAVQLALFSSGSGPTAHRGSYDLCDPLYPEEARCAGCRE